MYWSGQLIGADGEFYKLKIKTGETWLLQLQMAVWPSRMSMVKLYVGTSSLTREIWLSMQDNE